MAFASRKKPRRNTSITSSDFEFHSHSSPDCAGGAECDGAGRVVGEGGGEMEEGSTELEVLHEGYLTMSVKVEEEGGDRSGIMAHTLRTLRSNGSFSRVSFTMTKCYTSFTCKCNLLLVCGSGTYSVPGLALVVILSGATV